MSVTLRNDSHGFILVAVLWILGALAALISIYGVFVDAGNAFRLSGQDGFGGATYADLMTATDDRGEARSYLASEENFQSVRELHKKNLIVPVVADFAGMLQPALDDPDPRIYPESRLCRDGFLHIECRTIPFSAG